MGAFGVYMKDKLVKTLSNLDFFSHLKEDDLSTLANLFEVKEFDKEEVLFYEKDEKDKIYYLLEGELKIYKVDRFDNEIFLYYIGEHSMVTDFVDMQMQLKKCYANAVFTKTSSVLCMDFEIFIEFVKKDIKLYQNFIKECKRRLDKLELVITRDVVYDGTAKVAFEVANNLEKFNSLKKHEIAYELHMQPETLSRILAKMVRNKLIKIEKNRVDVLNLSALKEIYE